MENSTMQNLFGPLSKEYCLYFYIISIFCFVFACVIIVMMLFIGITKRKGMDFYFIMISGALGYGIYYLQNRILHSMCIGSI